MGKFIIALYTGTGNTLYVAKQFPDAEIHFMDEFLTGKYILPEDTEKLGIFFPVYYGSYPYPVQEFVTKILKGRDNTKLEYLFLINTAGRKSNITNYNLEHLLFDAGLGVSYAASISFPSGYLGRHQKTLSEMKILAAANKRTTQIARIIQETSNNELRIPKYVPGAFLVHLISKHHNKPTANSGLVVTDKCSGCQTCLKICPMDNIEIVNNIASFKDHCIHCYACYHRCPEKAISYKNKTACQYLGLVETKELFRR